MKKKMILVSLLTIVIGYACQNEFIENEESVDKVLTRSLNEDLSVASAKHFFETNIHALKLPDFKTKVDSVNDKEYMDHYSKHSKEVSMTHSSLPDLKKANVRLEWDKSSVWSDEYASYVEIPMNAGGQIYALKKIKKGTDELKHERTKANFKFVFRKTHGYNEPVCEIVTIIGHKDYLRRNKAKISVLKYNMEGSDFSGYIFHSDINGKPKKAYVYENGKITSVLRVAKVPTPASTSNAISISLFDMGMNMSSYSLDWEVCSMCGKEHEWWEECELFCPDCGAMDPETCTCFCPSCGFRECVCYPICEKCGYVIEACICCPVCGPNYISCPTCHRCAVHCECCKICLNNPCECPK